MRAVCAVRRGAEIASKPFVFGAKLGYRGVSGFIEHSRPRNKWVWGACVAAGIWAHRMTEVYAPKFIADIIVAHTVSNWGSFLGTIYGAYILAPGLIPSIVPFAAYAAGVLGGLAAVLAINTLCLLILGKPSRQNDAAKTTESL